MTSTDPAETRTNGAGRFSTRLIVTGVVVGIVAVSSAGVLVRLADADAVSIAFWRCLGGSVALAPFALRDRRRIPPLDRIQRFQLVGAGLFLAVHFALWIGSLSFTTVASSVTLVAMSPVFVGLGATMFLREPPSRRAWVGISVTIAGAIVIGAADLRHVGLGPRALLGDLMALGGAVTVAGYLLVGRAARQRLPVTVYASGVYGVAAVALLATALLMGTELGGYDRGTWLAIVALIVGPQLLGHTVFNALLAALSATVVAVIVLAEPVGAAILAWIVLGELPAPLFWVGGPLILVGLYVATTSRRGVAT